jgi:hypothetical protein
MKGLPTPESLALRRRSFATIVFGALVLSACESTGLGTNPSVVGILGNGESHPATGPSPSYSWQPYTTTYAVNTVLTDISNNNNTEHFIGVSYPKAGSPFTSFIAHLTTPGPGSGSTPSAGPPTPDPPNHTPSDVYLSAVNDTISNKINSYSVGYLTSGKSDSCSSASVLICGFIYDPTNAKEYELVDPNEGTNACAQTYLYGTMDANVQVGYYTTGSAKTSSGCVAHAVEEYTYPNSACGSPPCIQWINFNFPSSWGVVTSSKAYGTNEKGHVVGTYSTAHNSEIGWQLQDFKYTRLQYHLGTYSESGPPTQPRAIGFNMDVVGSYEDSSGNSHGFLYRAGNWSPENYNNNPSTQTIVYGFDDADTMVGAYLVGSYWNGFIAWCVSACDSP